MLNLLDSIYRPIQEQIEVVRGTVFEVWDDALHLVSIQNVNTLPKAKGKLLRPAICLLSAGALSLPKDIKHYIPMASAFELLHMASLIHDDVIDKAIFRRGGQSLNSLWDNHAAVLGGDYLVARAIELLGTYQNADLILQAVRCIREMAEGELRFFGKTIEDITQEDCIELARRKTATLFARASASPAFLDNAKSMDNLFRYGEYLGIAFQLIDDLLDLTQDTATLGKPACSDIAERKVTLPILLLWNKLNKDERDYFRHMYGHPIRTHEQEWIQSTIQRYRIDEETKQIAEKFIQDARSVLTELAETQFKESLLAICDFVVSRTN